MTIGQEYQSARRANEMRYAQAMSIYDEIIKRYQPGGTFGQAALGQLEKQKVRDVGKETQQMISSGLYGTTTTAGLPGKWEAEVGAPARLRLEDIMMERLSQAQIGKAGFIERREDVYPDVGRYAGYAQQTAAAAPTRAPQRSLAEFMREFAQPTLGTMFRPPGAGGTGGKVTGTGPTPGGGYTAEYYEQKRLADETAAQKLKAEGRLTFGAEELGAQAPSTQPQPKPGLKPGLKPGQAYGAYGRPTYGPTTAKESLAYSKWKKRTGGSKAAWAMQYRV